MSGALFDTHLIVDWSARSRPSPARPAADAIWWAEARDGTVRPPVYVRTRADAVARLADLLAAEVAAGRRVLVGFDFPFGYPEGVARRLTGRTAASALWDWIAARIDDRPDNANRRYAVAAEINAAYDGTGPAWGRPAAWDHPGVPPTARERHGADHPPERRRADARARTAKSVWQLAYAGAVGSQALLGMPALKRLCADPRLAGRVAVWPLEGGFAVPDAPVVLAEVYPSLLRDAVRAARGAEEILDAAQVRTLAAAFAGLDRQGGLPALFAPPAGLDAAGRAAAEREEGWILGLGHAAALAAALQPPWERDPKRIYAQSFATVRAEAELSRFPADVAELAIRVIHACGMVDVGAALRFTPDVAAAARTALHAGAPVLCDSEMVAHGVIRRALPAQNDVVTGVGDAAVAKAARMQGTTRSAAAVEAWGARIAGAVVAIGNAPTALFRLLELIAETGRRPAAIFGFPVGFVGAAEAKAALAAGGHGVPFLTLPGRRGGSAMAAAAVNGAALGLSGDGT